VQRLVQTVLLANELDDLRVDLPAVALLEIHVHRIAGCQVHDDERDGGNTEEKRDWDGFDEG
jgi:hypothetical protein